MCGTTRRRRRYTVRRRITAPRCNAACWNNCSPVAGWLDQCSEICTLLMWCIVKLCAQEDARGQSLCCLRQVADLLLQAKANVNAEEEGGVSSLHIAAQYNHYPMAGSARTESIIF